MMRIVLGLAGLLVLAVLGFVAVGFWTYQGAVLTVPVDHKLVALTYDDGPNPPHTAALLEMLEKHGVKATFFPKGRNVEAFPDEFLAVVEAGHELGNHSYFHYPMTSLDKGQMRRELERSNALLQAATGVAPVFFRPPFGVQGIGLKRAVDALGMTSVLASANGLDWEETDAQQIARMVLESTEPGGIILLHDGHGDVDDPHGQDSRAPTVVATGIIIEALQAQGYSFVTVGELLARSRRE